jgi:predicted transcriptional regulator of viral defense system
MCAANYSDYAMICSMSSGERIVVLAEEQWGMFTRQQAEQRGMAWSTLSRMTATGRAERVGRGVYRLRGAEPPAQMGLRVAWLELAPSVPVWGRSADQGVVSHRSAATFFGLGDLPADVHEFTLPVRRQTRREDVRLHLGDVADGVVSRGGVLATRPARTAVDLLRDGADPAAVATIVAESLDAGYDGPVVVAKWLSAVAHRYQFGDGVGMLGWLLDLAGAADRDRWIAEATEGGQVA